MAHRSTRKTDDLIIFSNFIKNLFYISANLKQMGGLYAKSPDRPGRFFGRCRRSLPPVGGYAIG
jgi:hypothetical protein